METSEKPQYLCGLDMNQLSFIDHNSFANTFIELFCCEKHSDAQQLSANIHKNFTNFPNVKAFSLKLRHLQKILITVPEPKKNPQTFELEERLFARQSSINQVTNKTVNTFSNKHKAFVDNFHGEKLRQTSSRENI
jgi:hypothetical protein